MRGNDWPALEYPCEAWGGFGERDLLEFLLALVVRHRDAQRLAAALLRQFGTLAKVLAARPSEYGHQPGMSPRVTTLFALLAATIEKALKPRADRRLRFRREAQVKAYFARRRPVHPDKIRILFLDLNHRFIADETMSSAYARDIVGRAYVLNARKLVLVGRDDGLFQYIQDIGRLMQVDVCGFIRDGPKPTAAQRAGRQNREKAIEPAFASTRLPWND